MHDRELDMLSDALTCLRWLIKNSHGNVNDVDSNSTVGAACIGYKTHSICADRVF